MGWEVSETKRSGSNPDRTQLIGTSDPVLVVSNDFATQQSIVSVLSSAGIDAVGTAQPEATALQVIYHPAVAIVEHVPPADGGLALAAEIKDRDPGISILLLTDPSLLASAEAFSRASGRLVKPLEPDAFLEAVREALENRDQNGTAEAASSPEHESEPEAIAPDLNRPTDTEVLYPDAPSVETEEPLVQQASSGFEAPSGASATILGGPELVAEDSIADSVTDAHAPEVEEDDETLLGGSEAMQFAELVTDSDSDADAGGQDLVSGSGDATEARAEEAESEPVEELPSKPAEGLKPELAEDRQPEPAAELQSEPVEDLQSEPAEEELEDETIVESVIEVSPQGAGEEEPFVATGFDEAARRDTHRVVQDSEFADVAGVPAEVHLDDRLRNSLATLVPTRRAAAVFLVQVQLLNGHGIDGFSEREAVFSGVYERLSSSRRSADTVVSAGQGRFMVVCADVDTTRAAEAIASSIVRRLSDPVVIGATDVKVNATVGVVMTTIEDGGVLAAGELIEESLLALRLAGEEGRPWKLLDVVADDGTRAREQLPPESDDGEFRFAVQKVVDPRTRTTLGAEARLRWRRPRARAIWASRFADRAREANLAMLGRLVLERAEIASWRAREYIADALPPARESSSASTRRWSTALRRRWTKGP